ncbi:fructose PTS transporter subunit IIA [uncultured Lactobacillus sp.]|uniref:PTS sugar transporter subunit IIA n=1 Tax=uncultured Lactobacillus sp. TaxID=153152 RepID=UPI0028043C9F|nr:fructose PTS transporter subunit IIA [uncultured Lactobacillus sp.]
MEFTKENVLLNVDVNDKNELLEKIANYAQKIGFTDDPKGLLESFKKREEEYSTGLQDGFAIPHAKSEAVKEVGIIYARLQKPIEWKTYDNKPVTDVLALMVPPKNAGNTYLKMLASLSTALLEDDFKETLKTLTDDQKISDLINQKMGAETL